MRTDLPRESFVAEIRDEKMTQEARQAVMPYAEEMVVMWRRRDNDKSQRIDVMFESHGGVKSDRHTRTATITRDGAGLWTLRSNDIFLEPAPHYAQVVAPLSRDKAVPATPSCHTAQRIASAERKINPRSPHLGVAGLEKSAPWPVGIRHIGH